MVTEFDLPCTDCDEKLEQRELDGLSSTGSVTVAECPSCGGRYYPEGALDVLSVAGPTTGR
ncbi:MAG: hypothetical protein ABEJ40_03945 [Haloarculaceae archaeon]